MFFASIAALMHLAKIIALYHLLWCKRERGAFKPMGLMAIQFLIALLVLLLSLIHISEPTRPY